MFHVHEPQNLVGKHCCPTFVHAAHLPPLPLATFVHTTQLPLTSLTCVRTHDRASLVCTAVLHLYALLVCCQHYRPAFVRVAEPCWYPLLFYISMRCSSAINIINLHSYVLQNLMGMYHRPTFVHAAHLPHYRWLDSYVPLVCYQHH